MAVVGAFMVIINWCILVDTFGASGDSDVVGRGKAAVSDRCSCDAHDKCHNGGGNGKNFMVRGW